MLLEGLAPDGGLGRAGELSAGRRCEQLARWRELPYAELAFEILRRFADDIPEADLKRAGRAHVHARTSSAVPTSRRSRRSQPDVHLLGLSNGPTLAFKDLAMQLLGNLFEYVLAQDGQRNSTSWARPRATPARPPSTRCAASAGMRVFMLSPYGKMSPFQTAQMYSLQDPNIFNIGIRGVFDDCQDIVKAVSNDAAFKARHADRHGQLDQLGARRGAGGVLLQGLSGGRARRSAQPVSFAVPSGNFGNIFAGHIARQMGLPIRHLILATNENDVLDEFFRTGRYRVRQAAEVKQTSSPSMDISKASNFERFVYDLAGRDAGAVPSCGARSSAKGGFDLAGDRAISQRLPQFGFVSGSSTHADRLETIRRVYRDTGVMIDTHTADGVKVGLEHREAGVPLVCLETALPAKFAATIREALGREPEAPPGFEDLESGRSGSRSWTPTSTR